MARKQWVVGKRQKRLLWFAIMLSAIILLMMLGYGVFQSLRSIVQIHRATITVNNKITAQTISGFGGDYAQLRASSCPNTCPSEDPVGAYNLNTLNTTYARVSLPFAGWEPDIGTYEDSGYVHNSFLQDQELQQHGARLIISIWQIPDWLGEETNSSQWFNAIEGITHYLVYARDYYGVTFYNISWNEPDDHGWSGKTMAQFIEQAGPVFAHNNLPTAWLIGDVSRPTSVAQYANAILQDSQAASYTGPIAYHSWNDTNPVDFRNIAALGQYYHRQVWATEVGTDWALYQQAPSPFPTWDYAWQLAQNYYNVVTNSQAAVGIYWEYMQDFPLNDGQGHLYPAFSVVQQLTTNLLPGFQVVESKSNNEGILPLAATGPDHQWMVQMINRTNVEEQITVLSVPNTSLTLEETNITKNMAVQGTFSSSNNQVTILLPAHSIGTLTTVPPVHPTGSGTPIDDNVQGDGLDQFHYVGNWTHCIFSQCAAAHPPLYNDSVSWDTTPNDYVTLTFKGTHISLYGMLGTDGGLSAVSIDGGSETLIENYWTEREGNQLLWSSPSLSNGTHTFKLRTTGMTDSQSTGIATTIDRVVIW